MGKMAQFFSGSDHRKSPPTFLETLTTGDPSGNCTENCQSSKTGGNAFLQCLWLFEDIVHGIFVVGDYDEGMEIGKLWGYKCLLKALDWKWKNGISVKW